MDLSNHLVGVCTKALVDCPFKDQGCLVQVVRQDVDTHLQENMASHMSLLAKQNSILIKQCSTLTEQNKKLKVRDEYIK
jgi:hypothetical protein